MSDLTEVDSIGSLSSTKHTTQNVVELGSMITPRYLVEELIGKGGFGEVYRASDVVLKRSVALKILYRKESTSDDLHSQNQSRFLNEARITAQLKHPCLPIVHDFGQLPTGQFFIVNELLVGQSLAKLIRQNALTITEALTMLKEVSGVLQVAHDHGVLHRDIKPSNIFCEGGADQSTRCYKVLDFGIAKQAVESDIAGVDLDETKVGGIVGSPRYLAPERLQTSAEYGPPSDLYSLGVVFYACLTQKLPYNGRSMIEIGLKHLTEEIPLLSLPHLTDARQQEVQALLEGLLEKDPHRRIQTAREVEHQATLLLERLRTQEEPITASTSSSYHSDRQAWPLYESRSVDVNSQSLSSRPLEQEEQQTLSTGKESQSRVSVSKLLFLCVFIAMGVGTYLVMEAWETPPEDIDSNHPTLASHTDKPPTSSSKALSSDRLLDQGPPPPQEVSSSSSPLVRSTQIKKKQTKSKGKTSPSSSPKKRPSRKKVKGLRIKVRPAKPNYLVGDRLRIQVSAIGGKQLSKSCQITPSNAGSVQGLSVKLKRKGQHTLTCCIGETCKRRKLFVIDQIIDEF